MTEYLILVRFTRSLPEDIEEGRRIVQDVLTSCASNRLTYPKWASRPALTDGAAMLTAFIKDLDSCYIEHPGRMAGAWEVVQPSTAVKVRCRLKNVRGRWLNCYAPQQGRAWRPPGTPMQPPHYTVLALFKREMAEDLDIAAARHPNDTTDCALFMQFVDELNAAFTTGFESMAGIHTLLSVDAPIPVRKEDFLEGKLWAMKALSQL